MADEVDGGEWQGNFEPSKRPGAGEIGPNERKEWRSESDGILTGTSGWARWRIRVDTVHSEFVQVNWSVPFYGTPHVTCGVFRSDPSDIFHTPDPEPPDLEIVPVVRGENGEPKWQGQSERGQPALAEAATIAPYVLAIPFSFFAGPPWFVTHPRVGFVVRRATGRTQTGLRFEDIGPNREDGWMQSARHRMDAAFSAGFVGGFPNFYEATYGLDIMGGTILVPSTAAEWRDVPLAELDDVSLSDFGARMRAVNAYASRHGFVGGFPTYHHADYGNGVVCGVVLLKPEAAEWRDVPLEELGNPSLDDVAARYRATQGYASLHGFVGGFPNLFHAETTRLDWRRGQQVPVTVCGTVLLKPGFAEWRDILLARGPR